MFGHEGCSSSASSPPWPTFTRTALESATLMDGFGADISLLLFAAGAWDLRSCLGILIENLTRASQDLHRPHRLGFDGNLRSKSLRNSVKTECFYCGSRKQRLWIERASSVLMVGGSCIMGIWETLSGQKEEKTAIENLEEQMDDCCPSLSWTQVQRPAAV